MTSNDWESTGTSRHSHNTRSVPVPRSPPSTSCYFGSCRHQETWHNWKTSTTSTIEIHRSTNRLAEGRGAQSSNIERSTVALKASCVTPSGGDGVAVSWGSDYLSPWILSHWEVNSRIFTLVLQLFCMYKPWLPWSNNKLMFTSLTSWNAWSIFKGLFDHGRLFKAACRWIDCIQMSSSSGLKYHHCAVVGLLRHSSVETGGEWRVVLRHVTLTKNNF